MILCGFEMHLYCRESAMQSFQHAGKVLCVGTREERRAQYGGATRRDCERQARADGWKFVGKDVICPACAKKEGEVQP